MSPSTRIVLADDLTGAAEIAAVAHQAGWRAMVLARPPDREIPADVLVIDLDTRLASPADAARQASDYAARLAAIGYHRFFLKFDSVLRGPVQAQITAVARVLGRPRTLLAPANPSLGRVIIDGHYLVDGVPLNQTPFAYDPCHPRNSADVLELLGASSDGPCKVLQPGEPVAPAGLFIGACSSSRHVRNWARDLPTDALPAGAADFFRVWIGRRRGARARAVPPPKGPTLLLHGSAATPAPSRALFFRGLLPPTEAAIRNRMSTELAAALAVPVARIAGPAAPSALGQAFARTAVRLRRVNAFSHLVVAGGATAAAVLPALGWTELTVERVWGPGVVTLRPANEPEFAITLKPGSYDWPSALRRALPRELLT